MIAIISDTHDNVSMIKKAVEILKQRNPELVIHLGDVVAPVTAKLFSGLKIKFIKGNCDGDVAGIKRIAEDFEGEYLGEFAEINIKGKKFALYHGTNEEKLNRIINSKEYDYVLHGHTHRRRDEKTGKTRVINPGNLYQRHLDNGFAFLDVEKNSLEFVDLRSIPGVGIGIMIVKDNKVLLGKRHGLSEKADSELHGEGTWTMPGGKLEFGENFEDAAYREILEEANIKINKERLKLISVTNDVVKDAHFVTLGFLCKDFKGEAKVMEPDEITEWKWFSLDELPENIFFPSMKVIKNYSDKAVYKH